MLSAVTAEDPPACRRIQPHQAARRQHQKSRQPVSYTHLILKALCARKGVSFDALATFDAYGYKERQYDLLADVVRGGLDMSFVYRVLRREV